MVESEIWVGRSHLASIEGKQVSTGNGFRYASVE